MSCRYWPAAPRWRGRSRRSRDVIVGKPGLSLTSRNVRHDQPVRHARLEMLEYAGLSSRHADRQRLAVCHAKLDDIGAVGLRTVDHNAVLAARWSHAHLRCFPLIDPPRLHASASDDVA